jgi:Zn-dependent protease
MKFSNQEIIDLAKAWLILSIAFAVLLQGITFSTFANIFTSGFAAAALISAFTVGIGFLLHELSHKFLAQKYGCFAEFHSFDKMLYFALFISFFGFIFAAPGAVFIKGYVGIARNGKISAAGIIANLCLALLFLAIWIFTPFTTIAYYGFYINSWLALFNLIPIGNFDGVKVLQYSKKLYVLLAIVAGILMIVNSYISV